MTDVAKVIEAIESDPSLRTAVRRAILTDDLLALPAAMDVRFARVEEQLGRLAEAQARTEARVGELAQAQARTEARVGELAQAQARTEARLGELAQAQARTEARLGELAEAQARTEGRLGGLVGAKYAQWVRSRWGTEVAGVVPDADAQSARFLSGEEHRRLADGLSSRGAKTAVLAADGIMVIQADGSSPTYLVIEMSVGVGEGDVDRAATRAGALRDVGLAALGVVVGAWITPEGSARLGSSGVQYREVPAPRALGRLA